MGATSSKTDLEHNVKAMERKKKMEALMYQWYETVTQTTPPPTNDPNLLFHLAVTSYYYTSNIRPELSVDFPIKKLPHLEMTFNVAAVVNTILSSLADTTKHQTDEGYSTCVIHSFEGTFDKKKCLFKLILVAISFNFSSSEYNTDQDVALFSYWVYFLHTENPLGYGRDGEQLTHKMLEYERASVGRSRSVYGHTTPSHLLV
ncbi:hypothetical protein Clacol_000904 [Clathrus columnatus]|uniref:Uncharacterized protein n=1 Tax=Clathrus columnatus TaxID=1419009 RepID=A0AAV4ZZP8_9AGAM|nr:hypothetical protein Clacol_000904 [Clathrus columnatus]